jgi:hypothetical protein
MRFLTYSECEVWLKGTGLEEAIRFDLKPDGVHALRCAIPFDRLRWFSRLIVTSCETFDSCLLWPSGQGIWSSCENLHLYYRLRQTYGDHRLLSEAPGHLFLNYEFEDLATFTQLCLMFLWDTYLLTNLNYVSVLFSHDEFVEFRSKDETLLEPIRKDLVAAGIEIFE